MKTRITPLLMIACMLGMHTSFAQELAEQTDNKKIIGQLEITMGNENEENNESATDTTKIRVGKKEFEVVESNNGTTVTLNKSYKWGKDEEEKESKSFNGHWAGIDLGVNGFDKVNYSMYNGLEFMELNQPKSLEVNLNFWEYNISLQKHRGNIGLVTGMGISYNNYKFDNPYTIDKVNGIIEPIELDPQDSFKKSKLTVSYLTIPLMLEAQIPVNNHTGRLFLSGGILGGLNIGSHTKVKWNDNKQKDRGGFNVNPFKYAAIFRVGLNDIHLYATYNFSTLFKDGKGPELTPFSVGISLVNF